MKTNFEVGDRVIYTSGEHGTGKHNPLWGSYDECEGTVMTEEVETWVQVKWDNGTENSYHDDDLEFVLEEEDDCEPPAGFYDTPVPTPEEGFNWDTVKRGDFIPSEGTGWVGELLVVDVCDDYLLYHPDGIETLYELPRPAAPLVPFAGLELGDIIRVCTHLQFVSQDSYDTSRVDVSYPTVGVVRRIQREEVVNPAITVQWLENERHQYLMNPEYTVIGREV